MIVKVNCIYYKNINTCNHPDRFKFLWFKPSCCEPYKLCNIKKENSRPSYPPSPQTPTRTKLKNGIGFL